MRILAVIGALGIVVGIGAAVFFFGGFYSVAGTMEDPAIVHWGPGKPVTVRPATRAPRRQPHQLFGGDPAEAIDRAAVQSVRMIAPPLRGGRSPARPYG